MEATTTEVWVTIGALAAGTVALKTAGPLVLGGRDLPAPLMSIIALLASALLAALVVTETLGGEEKELAVDARALGIGVAGLALWLRAGATLAVVLAAATAAAARRVA